MSSFGTVGVFGFSAFMLLFQIAFYVLAVYTMIRVIRYINMRMKENKASNESEEKVAGGPTS